MRKRISRRRRHKNPKDTQTGIDRGMDRYFLGGEWKILGFVHIKPPRWTREYEEMRVRDLVRRIQDDLEELLARAYPTYFEEWIQTFAADRWREFHVTYEGRLRCVIKKSVAEELRPGVWEKITSHDKTISRRALKEYQQLLEQFLKEEPKRAANALVFLTTATTASLENLFVKRTALIKEIARTCDLWPVNLGLRRKRVKRKLTYQLARQAFARHYLIQLGLASNPHYPSLHRGGAELVSPFKLAAEELYTKLLMLRDDPKRHVWFPKVTRWAKRLFALRVPMTKSSASDWWKVAKVYLYERWDKAQEEFKPLIEHLGIKYPIELSSKMPYESNIKSRVIDNSLKDAFIALARPDL
jgi:hypothetical protein